MAIENLTTYTEEDDNNKLTVTAPKALGADVDRNENVYLYKDKTADHFDALNIDFEIYIASTSDNGAYSGMGLTVTAIGSLPDFGSTDVAVFIRRMDATIFRLCLFRGEGTAEDIYVCLLDTPYYCTLLRVAGNDAASLDIYDDSGRTNKVDTLAVAGYSTAKWRYIYGFVNWNTGHDGYNWDGYVQNLDLKEPPAPVTDGDLIGIGIIRKS